MSITSRLAVVLLAAILGACHLPTSITGSGDVVAVDEQLVGFDRLDVSQAFQVDVVQGDVFRVVLEVDDNVLEHVDVRVSGRTLELGLGFGSYSLTNVTLKAHVTMPALSGVELSGASGVVLTSFESGSPFDADLSGASSLHGALSSEDARFDLSGASRVELSGSCGKLIIDMSGASSASLLAFQARDVVVDASGASQASVHAGVSLSVDASGASHVSFAGEPQLRSIETSGAAHLRTSAGVVVDS
jgi:hypothetical protein